MKIDLKGKKAIVCGSTQGIGKSIAEAMASAGAEVVLIARNEEKLKEVCKGLLRNEGQTHTYLVADLSEPESLKLKLQELLKTISKVDILVNNTGGPPSGAIADAKPTEFQDAFSRHVLSNQVLVQGVLPLMKREKYGRILNIISTSVKEPIIGLGVSNTIRAAVAGWSKTLSQENARDGITVNNILPGYTKTGRLTSLIEQKALKAGKGKEEIEKEMLSEVPAGRFADPEEPAALAVFLASPLASYINGVNIQVDGGKVKGF